MEARLQRMPYGTYQGHAVVELALTTEVTGAAALDAVAALWTAGIHSVHVTARDWGAAWVAHVVHQLLGQHRVQATHELDGTFWPGGDVHWILDITDLFASDIVASEISAHVARGGVPQVDDLIARDPETRPAQLMDGLYRLFGPRGAAQLVVTDEPSIVEVAYCTTPWSIVT